MAATGLKDRGWHLTEEGIELCTQISGRSDIDGLIKAALDTDLKEIGQKWLPDDINRGRADYVQGPGMLQVQKIRNISAPKDHEESQTAPRLLKIVLTDGHIKCSAIETEALRDVGINTPPGSKILLKTTTDVEHGFLLLNNKNIQFCGGRVSKLVEGWELKKKLSKQQRSNFGSGEEPPPFVPFGQRIDSTMYHKSSRRDNFKSLESKSDKGEDDEFEQQRKATIAEAMKAKEDGMSKKFGGGQKHIAADHDIAKITEMGFRPEEAASALKLHNSNLQQAIEYLLGNKRRGPNSGRGLPGTNRQSSYEGRDGDRGRGRRDRDRKEDESGGPGKGRKGREPEEQVENTKPSGPATLFDFLETKFPVSETKGTKKDEKSSFTKPSDKTSSDKTGDDDKNAIQSGVSHSQSDQPPHNQSNRPKPQQNVPPRFVNKPRQDSNQGYNKGQGRYKEERWDSARDNRSKNVSSENRTNEERNYSERGDSRYSDRNSERNYSDRNYGNRDRNYGDRNYGDRNYGDRDRNYGDRDRNYGDRDRNYGDRNYGDRDRTYGDRNYGDRNYGDRDRNYGERERNYGNKNYGDRDRNYGDRTKDRYNNDKNYGDRDRNYGERNRNYGGKDRGSYGDNDRNRNYHDKKVSSEDSSQQEVSQNTNNNNSNSVKSNSSSNTHRGRDDKSYKGKQSVKTDDSTHSEKEEDFQEETNSQAENQIENGNHVPNKGDNYDKTQTAKYQSYSQPANYNKVDSYSKGGNNRPPQTGYRTGHTQYYGANNNYGQYNPNFNGNQPMVPAIHTSMGQYQQHPEFIYEVPTAYGLKAGDKVMAKYWEDSRYYEAVVEVVAPNLSSCVVTFVEYGNSEEVFLSDVQPLSVPQMHQGAPMLQPPDLSVPPPQMFFSGPPPPHLAQGIEEAMQGISSMEFRRGGGGASYHRKENRPAQQLYQPPGQRR